MFQQSVFIFSLFLPLTLATCPDGSVPWPTWVETPDCYVFHSELSAFINAETICNEQNGHLTSVNEGFTNTFLAQKANNTLGGGVIVDFWMGAMNLIGGETNNWTWIDGTPFNFTNWRENPIKKVKRSGQSCGSIALSDGRWNMDDCYKNKPFVCKIPNLPSQTPTTTTTTTKTASKLTTTKSKICSDSPPFPHNNIYCYKGNDSNSWTFSSETGYCYKTYYYANWATAEQCCYFLDSHLASFHSKKEVDFIVDLIPGNKTCDGFHQTLVGLLSNDHEKTWQWSDGTPVDYTNWSVGKPNSTKTQNYGRLITSPSCDSPIGSLEDVGIEEIALNYVCKKRPS